MIKVRSENGSAHSSTTTATHPPQPRTLASHHRSIRDQRPHTARLLSAGGNCFRYIFPLASSTDDARNRNKSRVRAKVEHQIGIIKRQFGFSKVRYRGLDKNAHRLFVACALSNLVMAKKTLLRRSRLGLQASCA
ncbi:MAG: transposase [Haliea sp.]|nr:transposase [Haliea sp.]